MDNTRIYIVEDSSIIRENLIEALQENAPVEVDKALLANLFEGAVRYW